MKFSGLFLLKAILDYIFPHRCCSCSGLVSDGFGICGACWHKFSFINKPYCQICGKKFEIDFGEFDVCGSCLHKKPKIDVSRSLLQFSAEAKKLIHNFKYNDKTNLAQLFAHMVQNGFGQDFADIDIIAPVPMHRLKRLFRKYNPPQVLADSIAKKLNKKLAPDLLIKNKFTKNQVGLNKRQRAKNLIGSISVNKKYDITNSNILLVDDVLTTGATSNECTKILKQAKAGKVKLITIARV